MVFRVPMSPTKSKRYWGTQRVARVLQVTPATVASWIDQGHLKGHKTPTGRRRVASADLAEFLRAHDMSVPSELLVVRDRPVVVVVEDDPGYLADASCVAVAEGSVAGPSAILKRSVVGPSAVNRKQGAPGHR